MRRHVAIAATLALASAALLATLAVGAPGTPSGSARSPCVNADRPAEELTSRELRKAVRCLINVERAVRGRSKLVRNRSLQQAAQRHAVTMVATDCLAHRCGDELELEERLRRAGYFQGADTWQYAESTGCAVSASAMVENWMAARFHRINIIEKTYRDIGVGVVLEPVESRCDKGYATFAVVFGWRMPAAD